MSNAVFVEALIVGCLFVSLGSWMHWRRAAAADRATRSRWRRLAVGFLVSGVSFSILLVLMWTRLNALHTMPPSNDPTALVTVAAGCAAFAVWETVHTVLAGRRRV
jgi:phosphatidylglycerophosphate synthase